MPGPGTGWAFVVLGVVATGVGAVGAAVTTGAGAGFVMTAGTGVGTIVTVCPIGDRLGLRRRAGAGVAVGTTDGRVHLRHRLDVPLAAVVLALVCARLLRAGCAAGAEA